MADQCSSCRFWRVEHPATVGECRRYPAVVEKRPGDWCGEYQGRPRPRAVSEPEPLSPQVTMRDDR